MRRTLSSHPLPAGRKIVIAVGKGALGMLAGAEETLGRLDGGIVVVPKGYPRLRRSRGLPVIEAAHPIPDRSSLFAARSVMATVAACRPDDLLILLLSGGTSSLLSLPPPEILLKEKREAIRLLLKCGATIQEVNTVRKHLSLIKGGRLAAGSPAPVLTLILSDVVAPCGESADLASAVGSGPTLPDSSRFADALAIAAKRGILDLLPSSVRRYLERGARGYREETVRPGDPRMRQSRWAVVGSVRDALEGAARAARMAGYRCSILTSALVGEAREAALFMASVALEARAHGSPVPPPAVILAGGETTVTVRGGGRGGRCREFVLAAAQEIAGKAGIIAAAFATDGIDGPASVGLRPVAGAYADGETAARGRGIEVAEALEENDSGRFFARVGGEIRLGPTGTNVNDLYLFIVSGNS